MDDMISCRICGAVSFSEETGCDCNMMGNTGVRVRMRKIKLGLEPAELNRLLKAMQDQMDEKGFDSIDESVLEKLKTSKLIGVFIGMKKQKVLPWVCECGNKWVDGLFVTWEECHECGGQPLHEYVRELNDNDEWYVSE